ncbi:MAG: DsbC family protein [Chromatiales bacterium]
MLLPLLQAQAADNHQGIRDSLAKLLPGVTPDSIEATSVPGLYEVVFGPRLVYMTEDGRYLIQGSIIDTQTRENLTEPRVMEAKIHAIDQVGEANMLIYSPPEGVKAKHRVNVFTDIDCGYCRKLHSEMARYNELGIEIRYLFYPRAGVGSKSYEKAVSVWCAEDRFQAMNEAKAGKTIESRLDCKNPVEKHMLLGELVGVSGTPALVLSDGQLIPGYVPADRLAKVLDERAQAQNQ